MTRLQHLLYVLGAWRFQRYRRWVGGLWREIYIEPTPHSSECGRIRWEPCTIAKFTENVYAFEQWPLPLPIARATHVPPESAPCAPECRCERCGYPWRGCVCGATPATGADPACDREPVGIQYGCCAVRDRRDA